MELGDCQARKLIGVRRSIGANVAVAPEVGKIAIGRIL
jgi:hypothetical protein